MMSKIGVVVLALVAVWSCGVPGAVAADWQADAASVTARIDGGNLTFDVRMDLTTHRRGQRVEIAQGEVVLDELRSPESGSQIGYDAEVGSYHLIFDKKGVHRVDLSIAVKPKPVGDGQWREASFDMPASRVRELELICDRSDLEVELVGAVRVKRRVVDDRLRITGVQGADRRFVVRWKPKVQALEADLVFSAESNTIATVRPGSLRLDTLVVYDVAQGEMDRLALRVPEALSVTQVLGQDIRDWHIDPGAEGESDTLRITLSRAHTGRYGLQVVGETMAGTFPSTVGVGALQPIGGIRAGGRLAIGTDSAIALVVEKSVGLSQIDEQSMPRVILDNAHPRVIPSGKVFYFSFASGTYELVLSLDHIVPSYDVTHRVGVDVGQDELRVDAQVELDIRDAPLREVEVSLPGGFTLVSVDGALVDDYRVVGQGDGEPGEVRVTFTEPVIGRVALDLRLELGRTPLGETHAITGVSVNGARGERGFLVLSADQGVELGVPDSSSDQLREVNTASVPVRVEDARYAYRFRDAGWSIQIQPERKPASIRVESFHLDSISEGVCYGNVAMSYFISGSPIDELVFRVDPGLRDVEFVGRDVRTAIKDEDDPSRWMVKLRRRVIGDYNIGVAYAQPCVDGQAVLVGGVRCEGVESQSGYLGITSHLDVTLTVDRSGDSALMEIDREELPGNYRLLIAAPLLASFKYTEAPAPISVTADAYDRGELLSAVVELTQIDTQIATQDNGETESSTTVVYKVKNSSNQYLAVQMPKGAHVWSTRLVEGYEVDENGQPKVGEDGEPVLRRTRITASHNKTTGELLIPLSRPRDPNSPLTIELVYGLEHADLGWNGRLTLQAPSSSVTSTFDSWRVSVPESWAIHDAGSMAEPEARPEHHGRVSRVLGAVAKSWSWAVSDSLERRVPIGFALLGIIGLFVVGALCRRWLTVALVAVVLIGGVMLGVVATGAPAFKGQLASYDDLNSLSFNHVMPGGGGDAPTLGLRVVPAWRQYAAMGSTVVVPVVGLLLMALGVAVRGWRAVFWAGGVSALIYGACHLPMLSEPMGHVLTWGVPSLLLLVILWRVLVSIRLQQKTIRGLAAAVFVLSLTGGFTGECAWGKTVFVEPTSSIVDRLGLDLSVEDDAMIGTLRVEVDADGARRFNVLNRGAILLETTGGSKYLEVVPTDAGYDAVIKRKGRYVLTIQFLLPLPKADENQVRAFELPVPGSLTNKVTLTLPGVGHDVVSPSAVRFHEREEGGDTTLNVIVGHGEPVRFAWRPRARQRDLEPTVFYATTTGVVRFDSAIIERRTEARLEIAQGQLDRISLRVPEGVSVTSLNGADIGTWRFDPVTHLIDARLIRPATGVYHLTIVTQQPITELPVETELRRIEVLEAERQRGTIGLVQSPSVYVSVKEDHQSINVDDFTRDAGGIIAQYGGQVSGPVRAAFRVGTDDVVGVMCHEVTPELRTSESASFTVSEERLVYNGTYSLVITKAGRFSATLLLPEGYDIDTLNAAQVSHWDEAEVEGRRTAIVHFRTRTIGQVDLNLTLSRSISGLPPKINPPRIEAAGSLKHTGQLVISADHGVRLALAERSAVSEFDPAQLGVRTAGALAFRLLRPSWSLTLSAELIDPAVDVEALHVAEVAEGMVRHRVYLRHTVRHAGAKEFAVRVPEDAVGVVITGSEVARIISPSEGQGEYRVELARKQFGRPYQLTVRYETRFERASGRVVLRPVVVPGAERQRGYLAVLAGQRVELAGADSGNELQSTEARTVPRRFGAGDLSEAALCYRYAGADYVLDVAITRHESADLLSASVSGTEITTVVTEAGVTLNRVRMDMSVGGKRHLSMRLPDGAETWSLLVGGRSTVPSMRQDAGGAVYLIPLRPDAAGELPVQVDIVYAVVKKGEDWRAPEYEGPSFDLPLHDVRWTVYVPAHYRYDGFKGTLGYDERASDDSSVAYFTSTAYEQEVQRVNTSNLAKALDLQEQGNVLADQGKQRAARQALESAWYYSLSDTALNEDARVQLHRLAQEQALVGLVENRFRLQQQAGEVVGQARDELGENFDRGQAQRIRNTLSKADSENLDAIIGRMLETQQAVAGAGVPLLLNLPVRGKALHFSRAIQVKPNTRMSVGFEVSRPITGRIDGDVWWAGGIFVVLLVVMLLTPGMFKVLAGGVLAPVVDPDVTDVVDAGADPDEIGRG